MPRKSKGTGGAASASGGKTPCPTGASGGPECANDDCNKPGMHLCARCRCVRYCSAACQKVHWKQGGHKQACIPAAQASVQAPPAPTPAAGCAPTADGVRGGGSCEGACIICLCDDSPFPIQSGCACRGDAGLAHVECRAEAAAHRSTYNDKYDGWFECATCGQDFTGAMQLGLAEAWWSKARRLPKKDEERLAAANNLAIALHLHAKYPEAEKMLREVLAVQMRTIDREHENTLATKVNLARSLAHQGKNAEAERIRREVLVVRQRVLGLEHPKTLTSTEEIASILIVQGKLLR
jgi:hypothetical protein